eukprot:gene6534-18958_t
MAQAAQEHFSSEFREFRELFRELLIYYEEWFFTREEKIARLMGTLDAEGLVTVAR